MSCKDLRLTVLNASPYNTFLVITVSKEDYLKAILEAESEGEAVISATLAHWLKVSPPAVTMAVRRLKKDGLVRVNADGRVRLTAAGKKIARKLTVRHHLIERMLAEIFGMEWYKVHDEAERLEHAVSPDCETRAWSRMPARQSDGIGESSQSSSSRLTAIISGRTGSKLSGERHLRTRPSPAGVFGTAWHSPRRQNSGFPS